jgi:phage terminase small subunit
MCYNKERGDDMKKLTPKQKAFCDYYIQYGNGAKAAVLAGYSKKTARAIANENLTKPYIAEYIESRMKLKEDERIASQDEVLRTITSIMRSDGEGSSDFARLKAAELMGKRYALFTDKKQVEMDIGVTIEDDL